jgi:signal transduction histidine kinase
LRKDGEILYADINTGKVLISGVEYNIGFFTDVSERKRAEEARRRQQLVESKLKELARALISPGSLEDISELVLEAGKDVTQSRYGFVGTLDPQSGNMIAHTLTSAIWENCQVPDKTFVFEEFSGLWGWVLKNRAPLFTNTPEEDPRSTGVPTGHIPVGNFLSVPVFLGEDIVGIIALCNSTRAYEQKDLDELKQIANLFALAVQRQRSEAELVEAKERAEAADKAKSEFLDNMSHEIRTPLNGIMGVMQFLQTTSLDEEQKEFVEICMKSSNRLSKLLIDILDLSRVEAGKLGIKKDQFRLKEVIDSIGDMFYYEVAQKDLNYISDYAPGIPEFLIGDSTRLTQILLNLVGNAIKYTFSGEVRLEVNGKYEGKQGYRLILIVADTGSGIADEQQEHIFGTFTQAYENGSHYSRDHDGAGLGLPLVQRLAALMGGNVFLESQKDQGTSVYVQIPFELPQEPGQGESGTDNDRLWKAVPGSRPAREMKIK